MSPGCLLQAPACTLKPADSAQTTNVPPMSPDHIVLLTLCLPTLSVLCSAAVAPLDSPSWPFSHAKLLRTLACLCFLPRFLHI